MVPLIHFHLEIGCCETYKPVFHLVLRIITLIKNYKKAKLVQEVFSEICFCKKEKLKHSSF